MIILRGTGVTKHFGGLRALEDVDFQLHEGEILGLIGPNGSGKTTLFNVITGFYHADSGDIHFQDRSIRRASPNCICRLGIARTFQIVHPFESMTVIQNVLVGATLERPGGVAGGPLLRE